MDGNRIKRRKINNGNGTCVSIGDTKAIVIKSRAGCTKGLQGRVSEGRGAGPCWSEMAGRGRKWAVSGPTAVVALQ